MSDAQAAGSDGGTITMYNDQQALVTEQYTAPSGAKLVAGTETIDDPTLVSVAAGTLTTTAVEGTTQPITIQGLGKSGTTVVHFLADGVDNTDLTVTLIDRPDESVTLGSGITIQDTPVPAAPTGS